jgi:hypothetical protein
MHSRLLTVLPYLLYGQALLCFPDSPAQCTDACSLSCLICFTYRLVYAVLTHLLNAQTLARCPALSSLWTGSSKLFWLILLNAQTLARCPALSSLWTGSSMLSWLTCSMHSRLLAVLPYLLYGQALLCCLDSPAQCTVACSLSCLIFFMDRLFYAVLTNLLTCTAAVQYLLLTVQPSPAPFPFSFCFLFRLFC